MDQVKADLAYSFDSRNAEKALRGRVGVLEHSVLVDDEDGVGKVARKRRELPHPAPSADRPLVVSTRPGERTRRRTGDAGDSTHERSATSACRSLGPATYSASMTTPEQQQRQAMTLAPAGAMLLIVGFIVFEDWLRAVFIICGSLIFLTAGALFMQNRGSG